MVTQGVSLEPAFPLSPTWKGEQVGDRMPPSPAVLPLSKDPSCSCATPSLASLPLVCRREARDAALPLTETKPVDIGWLRALRGNSIHTEACTLQLLVDPGLGEAVMLRAVDKPFRQEP